MQQRLADLGEGPESSLAFDQNFADSSQVTAERGNVEAVVGSIKESLADVEHALSKFETGTYGRCETCGDAIAEARLEAMPEARFCIQHASAARQSPRRG